ncbi:hypothetical protein [Desulfosporosinus orientis]|uniref:hypothetical protein n=1 Tax=Desulfosporosinus orientis TaxID=1563 RepID=UPI0011D24602|nr:hypothetical protein [Desulfosporosinus orientis]
MERLLSPLSGCGDCETWFTSGITRRFGAAPAAASGRASECWVNGCGRSRPTRDHSLISVVWRGGSKPNSQQAA